jgi:hypothetical protein
VESTVTDLTVTGIFTVAETTEVVTTVASPSDPETIDWTNGSIFYVTGMSANWTPNITNLPLTANRSYVIAFVLIQGATPYIFTSCQIAGTPTTIAWNNATVPTGTANRTEIASLVLIYTGISWVVVGNFTSYG